jgi:hypothetical protein
MTLALYSAAGGPVKGKEGGVGIAWGGYDGWGFLEAQGGRPGMSHGRSGCPRGARSAGRRGRVRYLANGRQACAGGSTKPGCPPQAGADAKGV